jgi:hypothetical protein
MPRCRVVTVGVGDERAVDRLPGIDEEIAGRAVEAERRFLQHPIH